MSLLISRPAVEVVEKTPLDLADEFMHGTLVLGVLSNRISQAYDDVDQFVQGRADPCTVLGVVACYQFIYLPRHVR